MRSGESLLAVDVGNTNTVLGVFQGEKLVFETRFLTQPGRTGDEISWVIEGLLSKSPVAPRYSSGILSSVVPQLNHTLEGVLRRLCESSHRIDHTTPLPMKLNVLEPHLLGMDRMVNAFAAREMYGYPSLVIDFGTATTFEVVGREGNYEGGIIAPGPKISMEALVSKTAQLPAISLAFPQSLIGKSTVQAMQAGLVSGYHLMIEGLIREIEKECGEFKHVIATGGLGRFFSQQSQRINVYNSALTLEGCRIIAERIRNK